MKENGRDGKGRFAAGNPGRMKGSKNRFTSIKEEFVAVYEEEGLGRIKLAELLDTDPKSFFQLFRDLYPKQVEQQIENSTYSRVNVEEAVRALDEIMAQMAETCRSPQGR